MTERDFIVLSCLDECIELSPQWGICPIAFRILKEEILHIMTERDEYLLKKQS